MTSHPDEGTLHAFMDGELPETEAATLERHVAECAVCAAALAEARGLVAGASRVVAALDEAPSSAGVARSPVAGAAPALLPRVRPPILRTRYARAAALLLLAGGTAAVFNRSISFDVAVNPSASSRMIAAGVPTADALPAATTAPPAASTSSEEQSDRAPVAAERDVTTGSVSGGTGLVARKAATPASVAADVANDGSIGAGQIAPTMAPPQPIASAAPVVRSEQKLEQVAVSDAAVPQFIRVTRYRTRSGAILTLTEEPLRASFAQEATIARRGAAQSAAAMPAPVENSYRWSSTERGLSYTLTGPMTTSELEAASRRLSELERLP